MALATPTAIMVAAGRAAQGGILVKGGASLEKAAGITAVILDKTGTLTEGRPEVTDAVSLSADADWLALAAAVEERSEHPLARAVVAHVSGGAAGATDFQSVPCHGATARIRDRTIGGCKR